MKGKGAVRAGKGFALFISNEDMTNVVKIIKSLEHSCALIDILNVNMVEKASLEFRLRKIVATRNSSLR